MGQVENGAVQPLTKCELQEIAARCRSATPGPWRYDGQHFEITTPRGEEYWLIVSECRAAPDQNCQIDQFGHQFDANYDFIAYARTDLPRALAALEEAWEFLVECRATLLNHGGRKDLEDLWWRLTVYTDGLEPAVEEA